jgi:uncharacterized protein YeaO (DUF488 family)
VNNGPRPASFGPPGAADHAGPRSRGVHKEALRASTLSAVVCPLTPRELPAALANLRLWNSTLAPSTEAISSAEGRPRLIYSFNCAHDEALVTALVEAFEESETVRLSFEAMDVRFCDLPPEKDVYLREGEVGEAPYGR